MFSCVYSISDTDGAYISTFIGHNKSDPGFPLPMDGSILFVINQAGKNSVVTSYDGNYNLTVTIDYVDLSSVPTLKFPTGNGTKNDLAFLMCSPRVSIQTRQVRAIGNGHLTLGKHPQSQGNIDFSQANYLLSYALLKFPTSSGPTSCSYQVGTDLMRMLMFGTNAPHCGNHLPPAPLANITAMYKQVIHSAMKTLLSGRIATASVPGGYAEEQMVFTSSLGHIIISAILFAFLTIALVAAQFRKGRVPFTLVNVAAALADSDVPQKSVEMTEFNAGTGERKVLKLVPGGDGRVYCVYESVD
jgi:hypothetical protein